MTSSCLDEQELTAILDGASSHHDLQKAVRHLDECDHCRGRLEQASGISHCSQSVRALTEDHDTPRKLDHVLTHLDQVRNDHSQSISNILQSLAPSNKENVLGSFGEFEVLDVCGQGGMGLVLKARDTRLDRLVAIKRMSIPNSTDFTSRFAREARAAAAVVHENVVTIHAADEHDGIPFLVMEFVQGRSLEDLIDQEGPLALHRFIELARQMTAGLQAVHEKELVHRDLKPANVLINETGKALLTDFGLAKSNAGDRITVAGALLGTPAYMSPEQARGETIDHRSDLFSLGATFYAMITGLAPFRGKSTYDILNAVCNTTPQFPREIAAVPKWVDAMIHRLLEKTPNARFDSAEDVLNVLQRQGEAADTTFASGWSRRRVLMGSVVGLAAVGCAVAIFSTLPAGHGDFFLPAKNQRFDDLDQAISAASDGDIVEVRGDGPYKITPIDLGNRSITIQSGPGCSPILQAVSSEQPILITNSVLKLAGVELVNLHPAASLEGEWTKPEDSLVIVQESGSLDAAFCRLRVGGNRQCVCFQGKRATFRNCVIEGPDALWVLWQSAPGSILSQKNNECQTKIGVAIRPAPPAPQADTRPSHFRSTRNSLRCEGSYVWITGSVASWSHSIEVDLEQNLLAATALAALRPIFAPDGSRNVQASANRWFRRFTAWKDRKNVYVDLQAFLRLRRRWELAKTLDDWLELCNETEPDERSRTMTLQEYDAIRVKQRHPAAGVDEPVGPGSPFHTWRQTEAFHGWLEE